MELHTLAACGLNYAFESNYDYLFGALLYMYRMHDITEPELDKLHDTMGKIRDRARKSKCGSI